MKHRHRRRSDSSTLVDPDFVEALTSASSDRQAQRKARQFCRQVQRALNLALADASALNEVSDLFVEEVSPAPDCGHLIVHINVPAGRTVADALGAIRRDAPRLRSEVAMAITRKRAPELSFVPSAPNGGMDDQDM